LVLFFFFMFFDSGIPDIVVETRECRLDGKIATARVGGLIFSL
jgi:hypothetical protein